MMRKVLLVIVSLLCIEACGESADTNAPAWDEIAGPQTTMTVPTSTAMQALERVEETPTLPLSLPSSTATVVHTQPHQNHALSMAELLSTPGAPPRVSASTAYLPPSPHPFTRGAESTEFGIQINACNHEVEQALPILKRLRVGWVKLQVRWGDMQAGPNRVDWVCMDAAIPTLNQHGFNVIASVVTAPAYLRLLPGVNGPPNNFDEYAKFVYAFLTRYMGMVQAVEVWNEPNLSAEWDWQIDGAVYRHLLASAYIAIKAVDPSIMVISGALASASFDSVYTHVDDQSFITKFRRYNGDAYTDCVGAHANGPDGVGDIERVASSYFNAFDQMKPICVTEFGYGLPVQGQAPKGFEWIMRHTVEGQVGTFKRSFAWAKLSGYVRLVIVWNLDYWGPPSDPNAPYALTRLGWESPAIASIAEMLNE
jgi:hypothetical protein